MKKTFSISPCFSRRFNSIRRLSALALGASLLLASLAGAQAENAWSSFGGGWSSWNSEGGSFGSLPWESHRPFHSSHFAPAPAPIHDGTIDPAMIKAGSIAEHRAEPRSTNFCWRYVKEALVAAGSVDSYPKTAYAREAGRELVENYGFVKLPVSRASRAPVGSVLVYGGTVAGHVELRTAHGFVSDFRSNQPSTLPFIGAYTRREGAPHKGLQVAEISTPVRHQARKSVNHSPAEQASNSTSIPGSQIPHGVIAATL